MDTLTVTQWVAYQPPNNQTGIWRYRIQAVLLKPDVILQVYQQNGLMYAVLYHNHTLYPIGSAVSPFRFDVIAYKGKEVFSLRDTPGTVGVYLRQSLKVFQRDIVSTDLLQDVPNSLIGTDLLPVLKRRLEQMKIPFDVLSEVINLQASDKEPVMTADMIHYDEIGPHLYKFKVKLDANLRMTLLTKFCTNLSHFPDFAMFLAATWVLYQEHQKEFDALRKSTKAVEQFQ